MDWAKLQLKELNIEISECGNILFTPNFIEDDKVQISFLLLLFWFQCSYVHTISPMWTFFGIRIKLIQFFKRNLFPMKNSLKIPTCYSTKILRLGYKDGKFSLFQTLTFVFKCQFTLWLEFSHGELQHLFSSPYLSFTNLLISKILPKFYKVLFSFQVWIRWPLLNLLLVFIEPTTNEQKSDRKSRSWMSWLSFRKKTEDPNVKKVYTIRSLKPTSEQIVHFEFMIQ